MLELNRILKDFYILNIVLTFNRKGTGPMEASSEILLKGAKQELKLAGMFRWCLVGECIMEKDRGGGEKEGAVYMHKVMKGCSSKC